MPLASSIQHVLLLTIVFPLYLISIANASVTALPSEIVPIVPACARECLESFINAEFPLDKNQPHPSFSYLCSHKTTSGLTLGDGAILCIQAERGVGYCTPQEANNAINRAYIMCQGQPNALRPAQTGFKVTVPLLTTGGVLRFPPPSSTIAQSIPPVFTSLPTTLVVAPSSSTMSFSIPPFSSTSSTSNSKTTQTSTKGPSSERTGSTTTTTTTTTTTESYISSATGTSNNTDTDNNKDSEPATKLTKGQVVGISVGAVAAIAVGGIIIFLARRCRQRRNRSYSDGFNPIRDTYLFGTEKDRNTKSGKRGGKHESAGGSTWIGPRLSLTSPEGHPPPPKSYKRKSLPKPRQNSVATSPAFSRTPQPSPPPQRPISRLLPAKPVLPLHFPDDNSPPFGLDRHFELLKGESASGWPKRTPSSRRSRSPSLFPEPLRPFTFTSQNPPSIQPKSSPAPLKIQIPGENTYDRAPASSRTFHNSTITEFEEDGGTGISAATPTSALPGQIWQPPPSAGTNRPETYYVADANGNWVLGDSNRASQVAELVDPTPVTARTQFTDLTNHTAGVSRYNSESQPFKKLKGSVKRASHSQIKKAATPGDVPAQGGPRRTSSVYSAQSTSLGNSRSVKRTPSSGHPVVRSRNLTGTRHMSADSDVTEMVISPAEAAVIEEKTLPDRILSPVFESPRSGGTGRSRNGQNQGHPDPTANTAFGDQGSPFPAIHTRYGGSPARHVALNLKLGSNNNISNSPTLRMVEQSPEPDERRCLPSSQIRDSRQQIPLHSYPAEDYQQPQPPSGPLPRDPVQHVQHPPDAHLQNQNQGRLSSHYRASPYWSPQTTFGPPGPQTRFPRPAPAYTQNLQQRQYIPQLPQRHQFSPQEWTQTFPTNQCSEAQTPTRPQPHCFRPQHPPNQGQGLAGRPPLPHHSSSESTKFSSGSGTCSSASDNYGSSSLLEKRLGTGRAEGMKLSPKGRNSMQDRWERRPFMDNGQWQGQGQGQGSPYNDTGATDWKPMLTPLRNGNDMMLNVI